MITLFGKRDLVLLLFNFFFHCDLCTVCLGLFAFLLDVNAL